jgi:membrane glycosyltransferase
MFAPGMHPVHRTVFLTGALAYLSAPLWAGFLALSTWLLITHANVEPSYFVMPYQLFPLWPSWRPQDALALAAGVGTMLVVPKLLAAVIAGMRRPGAFGGGGRLAVSVLLEIIVSALLAPVRMLFHTQFVLAALAGWKIHWKSPARADAATSLSEAVARHGWQTALGIAWIVAVAWHVPALVPWIAPVAAGLLLAIPLSVWSSRTWPGVLARRVGLFVTPDETAPPMELIATDHYAGSARPQPRFVDAVLDPDVHLAVRSAARRRSARAASWRAACIDRALRHGPDALAASERRALLADVDALAILHRAVRTARVHPGWTMGRRSRATIHTLHERPPTRRGFGTVARPL